MASMEKFTQRARRVLALAHQEAERAHQGLIGTEHLLLGLLEEEGGVAGRVLRELGLESGTGARDDPARQRRRPPRRAARSNWPRTPSRCWNIALEEARKMGHHYVGTEHLLLGLARTEGATPPRC